MSRSAFKLDRLQIGIDDLKSGRIDRRDFMKLVAALGFAAPLTKMSPRLRRSARRSQRDRRLQFRR